MRLCFAACDLSDVQTETPELLLSLHKRSNRYRLRFVMYLSATLTTRRWTETIALQKFLRLDSSPTGQVSQCIRPNGMAANPMQDIGWRAASRFYNK